MSRDVGLLLPPLDSEDAYPEVSVHEQVARGVSHDDLNLLDLFILDDLLVHEGLFHVDVQNCQVALLIRNKELLERSIPEDGGINTLIGVSNSEKLGAISCIEPFEVLIVGDGKNEVGLHDN